MYFGFFHSFNRGVEKRKIFCDKEDYYRAVHDLYEFNDAQAVLNLSYRLSQNYGNPISIGRRRELLVDLFGWCLMPNHFHFFSRPRSQLGLSKFHQKFGIGYTNYFNLKYKRSGVLFQGRYKKVKVKDDAQAAHLICYIHANSLELWRPEWKEKGLTSSQIKEALKFLENYRWSSHLDYLGKRNFPSLISHEFLLKFFNGPKGYEEFFRDWLFQYQRNLQFFRNFILE